MKYSFPPKPNGIQFFSIARRALYASTRAGPAVARATTEDALAAADGPLREALVEEGGGVMVTEKTRTWWAHSGVGVCTRR